MNFKLIALVLVLFGGLTLALAASGIAPGEALTTLVRGSFGNARAWTGTLKEMTPLLLAGVAVYVALQAGLFNIGVEGQFLVGACTATAIALRLPGPMGVFLAILAAMAVGGCWAWIAAWIRVVRGGHEVISTIMLNNIALFLVSLVVKGPLKSTISESATTNVLDPASQIGGLTLGRLHVSYVWIVGIVIAVALTLWLKRTVAGYELRATGAGPRAAEFAGILSKRVMMRAMVTSGAIAGLTGALQVVGFEHRFYPDFSPGYGFDALGVALLAGGSPLGLIPAALAFGALAQGGVQLSILGIPKGLSGILLGMLIMVFAAQRYREVKAS